MTMDKVKKKRLDNKLTKNLPSKLYNWTARKITGIHLHDMNCGLKSYRSEVVKSIEVYGEMHRYIPYLAKNEGFTRITEMPVHHPEATRILPGLPGYPYSCCRSFQPISERISRRGSIPAVSPRRQRSAC